MRIVEIREKTVSIASPIANAYIDFSKMTCSVVALITDVVREGRRVVGYGFNSNGRYGQGQLMRERFFPRFRAADPNTLVDETGANLDPFRIWATLMKNEKPGGHGERSVAVGTIDMAVWDAVAKIAGKPLYRLLADRYRGGQADRKVFVYAAGGYYYPGQGPDCAAARNARLSRPRLQGREDEDRRRAARRRTFARIEAVLEVVGDGKFLAVDANGRFDLDTAIAYGEAMQPYGLFWYEEAGDPLDYALQAELSKHYPGRWRRAKICFPTRTRATCSATAACVRIATGCSSIARCRTGLVEYLRTLDVLKADGWSPRRCVPHGGHQMSLNIAAGLRPGRQRIATRTCSSPLAVSPTASRSRMGLWVCPTFRVWALRPSRIFLH